MKFKTSQCFRRRISFFFSQFISSMPYFHIGTFFICTHFSLAVCSVAPFWKGLVPCPWQMLPCRFRVWKLSTSQKECCYYKYRYYLYCWYRTGYTWPWCTHSSIDCSARVKPVYCHSGSILSHCLLLNWLIKGARKRWSCVFISSLSEELANAVPNVVAQVPCHHHDEKVEHQDEVGYEQHYDGPSGIVPWFFGPYDS